MTYDESNHCRMAGSYVSIPRAGRMAPATVRIRATNLGERSITSSCGWVTRSRISQHNLPKTIVYPSCLPLKESFALRPEKKPVAIGGSDWKVVLQGGGLAVEGFAETEG